jgi:hypothetical protein
MRPLLKAMPGSPILLSVLFLSSCSPQADEFKKKMPGLEYKIISHGEADKVAPGETIKMHIRQVYRDSVLSDTRDSLPFYQLYDSSRLTRESYEIFGEVRKGDSLVFKALTDSAFKNKKPPFVKMGEHLYTTVYVIDILGPKFDVSSDFERERLLARKRDSIKYFQSHPEAVPR